MSDSLASRFATLARVQVAVALTAVEGMRRYTALTASYGEDLLGVAAAIARASDDPDGSGWGRAAANAVDGYGDYVRGLAALPGIASMHYYDQVRTLRAAAGAHGPRSTARVLLPTTDMLALAASLAPSAPSDRPSAPSKEQSGTRQ
jgi:hypothetical protein